MAYLETDKDVIRERVLETVQLRTAMEGTINAVVLPAYVDCAPAEHTMLLSLEADPWSINVGGIMHGGAIATAVDIAMGMTVRAYTGAPRITTASLSISYLRPVQIGETVFLTVCIDFCGRLLLGLTAKGHTGDPNRPVFTASSTYCILSDRT